MVKNCKKEEMIQAQRYPGFFKVFLPQRSSERLLLPLAFIAHLNKIMPEKINLRSRRGRIWHVEVSKTEDRVYFQNGWHSFVRDNSIELGDMLFFQFNGDSIFDVKILGKTGCEKKEMPLNWKIDSHVEEEEKIKEEKEEEEDDEDDDNDSLVKEDEKMKKEIEEDDDDNDNHIHDDDSNEDSDYENHDDDDEKEEFEEDDEKEESEEDEELKAETFKVQMLRCKTKSRGRGQKKFGVDSNCGHKAEGADEGASAVKKEGDKIFEVERYVQPGNPYFVTRIKPGKKSILHVPSSVLKDHYIRLHPKMILRGPDGRDWHGRVTIWQDGRTWIGRWRALCRWNNIGKDDICICEFLQGKDQRGNVIQVHIIRAGAQTADT